MVAPCWSVAPSASAAPVDPVDYSSGIRLPEVVVYCSAVVVVVVVVESLLVAASASAYVTASDERLPDFALAVVFVAVAGSSGGWGPCLELGLELNWDQQIRSAAWAELLWSRLEIAHPAFEGSDLVAKSSVACQVLAYSAS